MSRAAASPVLRTALDPAARRAASGGLPALAQVAWSDGRLVLLKLVIGIICGFLALAPGETAPRAAEPHSGGDQLAGVQAEYAPSTKSVASSDGILNGVERATPPTFGGELEAAEFEQEDEEEQSKGVATDNRRAAVSEFPRSTDERFRRAVFAFFGPLGDFRELPRGPPSIA